MIRNGVTELTFTDIWNCRSIFDPHQWVTEPDEVPPAVTSPANDVETIWHHHLPCLELVLGTGSRYELKDHWPRKLSVLLGGLYGLNCDFIGTLSMWEYRLERLKVHPVIFELEKLSSCTTLRHLRILMLRPKPKAISPIDFDKPLPADPEQIASRIAFSDLPSLRVIMIRDALFWIQRDRSTNLITKLWAFSDAKSDALQSRIMMHSLSPRDWSFIEDIVETSLAPNMQIVEYKSYLVMSQEEERFANGSFVPKERIKRFERKFTDLNFSRNGTIAKNTEVAVEEEAEDYDWSID